MADIKSPALSMAERAFVVEFLKDFNPTLAAERIGHDELVAPDVAYEMLGKQHVQDAMAHGMVLQRKAKNLYDFSPADLGITEGYIMMRLKNLADRAPKPEQQIKALELLGKTIGAFKETARLEVSETKGSGFSPEERRKMIEAYKARYSNDDSVNRAVVI